MATLELAEGPTDEKEKQALEQNMGFSYRQAIGEAIFAMTICRIDISPAIIKLSQYSEKPAKCHYQALKNLFAFLNVTKGEGLYYWRQEARMDLPNEPLPVPISNEESLYEYFEINDPLRLKAHQIPPGAMTANTGNQLEALHSYYRVLQSTIAQKSKPQ